MPSVHQYHFLLIFVLCSLYDNLINLELLFSIFPTSIETAKEELKQVALYDKVIINYEGEVDKAFEELYSIINEE